MTREVTAAVVRSRVEADLMVGMLREHGVRARVSTDDAGGVEAALQMQGVRILVSPEDRARTLELIGESPPRAARLNAFQRWVVRILGGGDRPSG